MGVKYFVCYGLSHERTPYSSVIKRGNSIFPCGCVFLLPDGLQKDRIDQQENLT